MSGKTKKVVCRASSRKVFSTSFEGSSFSTLTRFITSHGRLHSLWCKRKFQLYYHASDDLTLGEMAERSSPPLVPRGGLARLCCAVRRTGYDRHNLSPADHPLALDFTAAGVSRRLSGFRLARPRWPSLQLVRHRPIAAHATGGRHRDVDLALADIF